MECEVKIEYKLSFKIKRRHVITKAFILVVHLVLVSDSWQPYMPL
ncbi:MAG: hypothetical protein ACI9YE_003888 [Psychroserpens sp.]|jgi:hypothetical protein